MWPKISCLWLLHSIFWLKVVGEMVKLNTPTVIINYTTESLQALDLNKRGMDIIPVKMD